MLQVLGKIGFTLEGNWQPQAYKKLVVVLHQDGGWCCPEGASAGDVPGVSNAWVKMYDSVSPGGNVRIPVTQDMLNPEDGWFYLYVSVDGNDSNDGRTWGTAKKTLNSAYLELANYDCRGANDYYSDGSRGVCRNCTNADSRN